MTNPDTVSPKEIPVGLTQWLVQIGERGQSSLDTRSWFVASYDDFEIDDSDESVGLLRQKMTDAGGIEVYAFIGLWCGDTREHWPALVRVLDVIGFDRDKVGVFLLGRDKILVPWTEQYQITRVPTFVVLRDGREIGRITESPEKTLVADLLKIVSA